MIHDIEPNKLIEAVAKDLEATVKMPEWAQFVKTGAHVERVPTQKNWWQLRAASVLRTVALKGPIGVSKLRVKYGGRKNMGNAPDHFVKAGGKIIRTVLQQLEEAKLIKQDSRGVHKGRVITGAGYTLLNGAAKKIKE